MCQLPPKKPNIEKKQPNNFLAPTASDKSLSGNPVFQGHRNSGRVAVKEFRTMRTKKQKIVTNCTFFCSATMLTSKITIIETILKFLGVRIDAINMYKIDLNTPLNNLRYFHKKAPPPPGMRKHVNFLIEVSNVLQDIFSLRLTTVCFH